MCCRHAICFAFLKDATRPPLDTRSITAPRSQRAKIVVLIIHEKIVIIIIYDEGTSVTFPSRKH